MRSDGPYATATLSVGVQTGDRMCFLSGEH